MDYQFSIATWNINSVRLRKTLVQAFLDKYKPDLLCLQETKCPNEFFPYAELSSKGYNHIEIHGQKSYNGVAILSRYPLTDINIINFCEKNDCRYLTATISLENKQKLAIHNVYVPAGGDEPDPASNPKFAHKLQFLHELKAIKADHDPNILSLLVGDLNIAPHPEDVWSHKQLLKVVSHTPIETELLLDILKVGGWADLVYETRKPPTQNFTWWSYRSKDWKKSNRGRRLDHIWGSPALLNYLTNIEIICDFRDSTQPSDHVPIIAHFKF